MLNIIDQEVKKSNKKNQINNFNINIYTPKVQFPLNQINIENNNSSKFSKEENDDINNSYRLGKINSEISYDDVIMDIKDNVIVMDNSDENSNILYSKIKYKENKNNKDNIITTNASDNQKYNSNIIKLFEKRKNEKFFNKKNKNEKTEIKTNDKISVRSASSDESKLNLKNQNNILNEKNRKFSDLDCSQSTSFTINSSYDNINQISNYKYYHNSELREKTKNFILEEIKDKKDESSNKKNINDNYNLIKLNTFHNISPNKLNRRRSAILGNITVNRAGNLTPVKRASLKKKIIKFDSHINASDSIQNIEGEENSRKDKKFFSVINKNNSIKKRNSIKKKPTKSRDSVTENDDKTFYSKINKMRTMKKRNVNNYPIEEKIETEPNNKKMNYDILISKNIENNQENLNNPQKYFEGFFNDIIFKKNKNNNNLWDDLGIKKRKTFQK